MIKSFFNKFKNASVEVKASISYTICNILQKCVSFITLPLFTRLLTKAEYGQSSVYQSWESILAIFVTLYLAYGSFNKAMVKYEDRREEYISSINGIVTMLGLVFLAIYLPFRAFFNKLFELPTILIVAMVVQVVLSNALSCWQGKKRFEFKYKSVIAVTLSLTILTPVFSYIMLFGAEEKGVARILGGVLATFAFGAFAYVMSIVRGKKFFNKEYWKYALSFNIPLIPYYLSQVVFNQSDRIMIDHMLGKAEAASYSVAYNLAIILTFVLNAINNSYVPWLYGKIKNGGTKANKKVSLGIATIMAVLLLCLVIVAPEFIQIMAGAGYADAVWVVPPVAMSLLFLFYAQLFINIEFYFEEKKGLVFGTAFAAVVNIVLNYIFIPLFGFVAAAYTTLISYILFAFMNYLSYRKLMKKNGLKDDLYNYKALIGIAIIFMVVGFAFMLLYKYPIVRYEIIVAALALAVVFRKELKGVYTKVKNRNKENN